METVFVDPHLTELLGMVTARVLEDADESAQPALGLRDRGGEAVEHVFDGAVGRGAAVDGGEARDGGGERVGMGLDEPGDEDALAGVERRRGGRGEGRHLGTLAGGDDAAVEHEHGVDAGALVVEGDRASVGDEEIGHGGSVAETAVAASGGIASGARG